MRIVGGPGDRRVQVAVGFHHVALAVSAGRPPEGVALAADLLQIFIGSTPRRPVVDGALQQFERLEIMRDVHEVERRHLGPAVGQQEDQALEASRISASRTGVRRCRTCGPGPSRPSLAPGFSARCRISLRSATWTLAAPRPLGGLLWLAWVWPSPRLVSPILLAAEFGPTGRSQSETCPGPGNMLPDSDPIGAEGVAGIDSAAVEPALEHTHALLGGAVGEGIRYGVPCASRCSQSSPTAAAGLHRFPRYRRPRGI